MNVKRNGQSLVEFALILPILMLLLLGIIEGAHIVQAYISAQNASREAARFAVAGLPINPNTGESDWPAVSDIPAQTNRVQRIKDKAIEVSRGTGYTQVYSSSAQYTQCQTGSNPTCSGVLAVYVEGQMDNTGSYVPNMPGIQGTNIRVDLYHNVQIWDPIYAAIAPGGFVRVRASTVMRNEGVDVTLNGTPPVPNGTRTAPITGTQTVEPIQPFIDLVEGVEVETGNTYTARLRYHNTGTYYICLGIQYLTTVSVGSPNIPVTVPVVIPGLPAGFYELRSRLDNNCSDPAFYATSTIHVGLSNLGGILVNGGAASPVWPFGSRLKYTLINHSPQTAYDVSLRKPDNSTQFLATLTTNIDGSQTGPTYANTRPPAVTANTYVLESTMPATRAVRFIQGCLNFDDQAGCNQAITLPDMTPVKIHLRSHAHNWPYKVVFAPGTPFQTTIMTPTTDGVGNALDIPFNLPTLPAGPYDVVSYDIYDGDSEITKATINISGQTTPYIAVANGYTWPAGTRITFQLRNHVPNQSYDLFWQGTRIITGTQPVLADGTLWLEYVIPVTTPAGPYTLTSKPAGAPGGPVFATALKPIQVTGAPYLKIAEGNPQIPGATITILLGNHALNTNYDLYIVVNNNLVKLPNSPVGTDANGAGSMKYVIPGNLPVGQTYQIRSYLKDTTTPVVATTNLTLVAPDLRITNIQAPNPLVYNEPMVLTITVQNFSAVTITHSSFDYDLYIDPPTQPNLGRALPPGDIKGWIQPPLAANGTKTFTSEVTLYGAYSHELWGRVDTSNRIVETVESNNLFPKNLTPSGCQVELRAPALASKTNFGNTSNTTGTNLPLTTDGTIYIGNNGRGAFALDDTNTSESGYQYGYHQLEGDFDVRVRFVLIERTNGSGSIPAGAAAGLEIRSTLNGQADKLQWMRSYGNGLLWLTRQNNTLNSNPNNINPGSTPAWLRIVKNGSEFTLYYANGNSSTPPTNWTPQQTLTMDGLSGGVHLGLMNTPSHPTSSSFRTRATLDGYHVCSNSNTNCGPVRESSGRIIVNASNVVENIPASGLQWTATTSNGKIGMFVNATNNTISGDNYVTTSPQIRYEVDVTNPGRYYVWFLGKQPDDSGDSLHFGLTSSPAPGNNYWTTPANNNTLAWFNNRNSPTSTYGQFIDINQVGTTSLSAWMREDGFQLYQILLTRDPNYNPANDQNGLDLAQSACSSSGVPPSPPGLQQCQDMIENGNFENDALMSKWIYPSIAQQVTRTSVPHWLGPNQSFSMLLPDTNIAGTPRSPWLYQVFQMPTWVMTPTVNGGTAINIKANVGINNQGSPQPDQLYVGLRDAAGQILVTAPITLATGAESPTINLNVPNNNDWLFKQIDLAQGFNPPANLLNYRGQDVSLYFHAPNPAPGTDSTIFYLDNVALEVCTTEPRPTNFTTLVSGQVRVLIDGIPTPKAGVYVWTYAIDGSMQKTYTIQDSTFSFYNLPATAAGTTYVLYAEYSEDGEFYSASTIIVLKPGQAITNLSMLLF